MNKVGDRVGAISHTEGKIIYLFGYGIYEGNKVPEDSRVGMLGISFKDIGKNNPCIKLDNGKIVWGCECWWGSEEDIKKQVAKHKKAITIDIEQKRNEANEPDLCERCGEEVHSIMIGDEIYRNCPDCGTSIQQ